MAFPRQALLAQILPPRRQGRASDVRILREDGYFLGFSIVSFFAQSLKFEKQIQKAETGMGARCNVDYGLLLLACTKATKKIHPCSDKMVSGWSSHFYQNPIP